MALAETYAAALGVSGGSAWPPAPKLVPPMPPFPPGTYDHVLPPNQIIPAQPDRRWPRANWFSVEVPGLPWVDGQSSEHPEMVLSFFFHKYDATWRRAILDAHAARGLTHFMLSWADCRDEGMSLETFVGLAAEVKARLPFLHVMLCGKNSDPRDAGWDVLRGVCEPVLDALMARQLLDLVSFWETDLWQGPKLQTNYDGIRAHIGGEPVDQWAHFSTEKTWWENGEGVRDRVDFWNRQRGILTGILYQADVAWSMDERQARMCDTTNRAFMPMFADGTFKFCAAEMDGMNVYNPAFSEELSELRGFLHLCTHGLAPICGYCSGARYPSGPKQGLAV